MLDVRYGRPRPSELRITNYELRIKKPAKDISAFRGFFVKELFLCAVELNKLFEVSAASLCGLGGLVEELFGAVGEGACE